MFMVSVILDPTLPISHWLSQTLLDHLNYFFQNISLRPLDLCYNLANLQYDPITQAIGVIYSGP